MAQANENTTISGSYILNLSADEINTRLLKVPSLNILCESGKCSFVDERIVVEISHRVYNGIEIKFIAPADCATAKGLTVHSTYYEVGLGTADTYSYFDFAVGTADAKKVFKEGSLVKVVLTDLIPGDNGGFVGGNAYILNADTNAYLEGKFTDIETSITDIETSITELNDSINDISTDMAAAKTAIEEVRTGISKNAADVKNVNADVASIDARVSVVESGVATANTDIEGLRAAINAQVSSAESSIAAANASIESLRTTIENNATIVNEHATRTDNPHAVSPAQIGAVPTSTTVNSKPLTGNIKLSASDVGAVPTSRTVNGKALSSNITLSANDVVADPAGTAATALAKYNIAPTIVTGSCDAITEHLALLDIQNDNEELHNMLAGVVGGKATITENYAYIFTTFYSSTESSRIQIAVGYSHGTTATRAYYANTGWTRWNMAMQTRLNRYSYGDDLPATGTEGQLFFKKVSK